MFGFFKDRQLLEQKQMIWQNLFGSLAIIECIECSLEFSAMYNPNEVNVKKRLIEKLKSIHLLSSGIINDGLHKEALDKSKLNYIWQDNKIIRRIYEEHVRRGPMFSSFDEFVNPPYGWDVALEDWN